MSGHIDFAMIAHFLACAVELPNAIVKTMELWERFKKK